ncbi:DUF5663 domain-containing protein [Candidatus Saccharibacteria bacterium]|nr:DUF5663 domain-containing protein [Candidatus Saccharibacteria bacterium]
MYQLDDSFLESVGLADMPTQRKEAFLGHVREELEVRVGAKMSDGLSPDQIEEFEKIIDGDNATIDKTLLAAGDYQNDEIYTALIEKAGFKADSQELKNEYASIVWLTKNRPDYRQIVADTMEELKKEISANKDQILS